MAEKRDAYVKKLKAELDEWNAEIDKLAAKADGKDAEAKIEYQRRLEDLRARQRKIEKQLTELQQAGDGAWEDLKQGLDNSWQILKASFSKAKGEFERGYKEGRKE
ncbi:MAG: hypothetical protein P8Y00_07525 [Deltaproteobacteria bacterium]